MGMTANVPLMNEAPGLHVSALCAAENVADSLFRNTFSPKGHRAPSGGSLLLHTHTCCHLPRLSVVQLQEKELPELRNRLQAVNREMEKLKGDVEEQESLLATLISQEEMAKACLQDVSLMDRYLVEFRRSSSSLVAPSLPPNLDTNLTLLFLRWT